MKYLSYFLAAAAIAISLAACTGNHKQSPAPEGLAGTWNGEIEGLGLALVMHLGDSCTVDSPDQGAFGLVADATYSGESVQVKFRTIPGGFKGSLQGDSLIGTFSQLGLKKRLAMGRGDIVRLRPQTPEPPFPYRTGGIQFGHGDIVLDGTITIPEGKELGEGPAVVLVSGSGPQNRDEELMGHKPFAIIADALAREGIASLRYDDRGCGASGGVFEKTTTMGFAEDASSAVEQLHMMGYSRVGVIGHSEGGTIAFIMAGTEREGLVCPSFIVSLAGMAERGDKTLTRQLAAQAKLQGAPDKLAEFAAKAGVKKLKKGKDVWMRYFLDLDPTYSISHTFCPVLALNGEKDTQVIPEYNLNRIAKLCPQAVTHLYPDLNHLFQHCTTGLSTEYSHIEETFSPEVLSDIAAWINASSADEGSEDLGNPVFEVAVVEN